LHALNAVLLFAFVSKLLSVFTYPNSFFPVFIAASCFLISPYHTEVIVWSGAFNYLLVSCFVFFSLYSYTSYLVSQKTSAFIATIISFGLAAFSHELGLFLIPAYMVISLIVKKHDLKKSIYFFLIVSSCAVIYLVNRSLSGSVIGHYGAQTHLNFQLVEMIGAVFKYLLKIILLSGFWPVQLQESIYNLLQVPSVALLLLALLISCLVFLLLTATKANGRRIYLLFFLLFLVFVFPVLNLYFPYWTKIHADRYCYLPSAFLYTLLMCLLFRYGNIFKWFLPIVYIYFSIVSLTYNLKSWQQAGAMQDSLETDFRWWTATHIYILNLPDNFRGAYMYRSNQPSSFAASFIKWDKNRQLEGKIIEVLGYNLNDFSDSVYVEKVSGNKLKVTLAQWGTWWWGDKHGGTNYENEWVRVNTTGNALEYFVEFKQKKDGDIYIYAANGKWNQLTGF
jgi:hypothetical protein